MYGTSLCFHLRPLLQKLPWTSRWFYFCGIESWEICSFCFIGVATWLSQALGVLRFVPPGSGGPWVCTLSLSELLGLHPQALEAGELFPMWVCILHSCLGRRSPWSCLRRFVCRVRVSVRALCYTASSYWGFPPSPACAWTLFLVSLAIQRIYEAK